MDISKIGFVRETVFATKPTAGGALSLVGHGWSHARRKNTRVFSGMRPYYRRTLRNGAVRVYFRSRAGRAAGTLQLDAEQAARFQPSKTYTIEISHRIKSHGARKHRREHGEHH